MDRDSSVARRTEEEASRFLRRCEKWDREREPFYYERSHWRRQRQAQRAREEASDAKDAELEQKQLEAARVESEKFLKQQEEEMKKLAEQQRAAGVLLPGAVESGPIKLTMGSAQLSAATSAPSTTTPAPPPAPAPALLGNVDDDEEVAQRKKRIANISFTDPKTEAELRVAKIQREHRIRESLPKDWSDLSALTPDWKAVRPVSTSACVLCEWR